MDNNLELYQERAEDIINTVADRLNDYIVYDKLPVVSSELYAMATVLQGQQIIIDLLQQPINTTTIEHVTDITTFNDIGLRVYKYSNGNLKYEPIEGATNNE